MNNNSKAAAKRTQVVYSEPKRILVSSKIKTTKSGVEIKINRYKDNPNAKFVKEIVHDTIPGDKYHKAFNQFNKFKRK